MTAPTKISIYALLDEQRQVRYVGQSKNPEWRAQKHWRERGSAQTTRKNALLNTWLRTLAHPPQVFVFQEVDESARYMGETYWTDLLRGIPSVELLNISSGSRLADSTRAKIGVAHRGRRLSDEMRSKISAATIGREVSDETRAKMRASHLGKELPLSVIAKRSASVRGSSRTPETRERMKRAAKEREAKTSWCETCQRSWSASAWPRHVRKYHEGGAW